MVQDFSLSKFNFMLVELVTTIRELEADKPEQPMITQIDHIGIAVKSLDEGVAYYEQVLGLRCAGREEVASQRVRTAFFEVGEVHLELLEPTDAESPIAKFLEKNGEGIHHVAFRTDDIGGQLAHAAAAGCRLIHEVPFAGANNKLVAFLHPKSTHGVLTELCACGDGAAH
jgi:methylmalonyl-CoA/ethylmalonyl-CoA epimerase